MLKDKEQLILEAVFLDFLMNFKPVYGKIKTGYCWSLWIKTM